jgi:hypothetical protein
MTCMPAGTLPNPTIHLHPPVTFSKPASIPYAMTYMWLIENDTTKNRELALTWPRVIMTTLRTTMRPRRRVGEAPVCKAARYTMLDQRRHLSISRHPIYGDIIIHKRCRHVRSICSQRKNCVNTTNHTPNVMAYYTAWPIAPPMNTMSVTASTSLRQVQSDIIPAPRPPSRAPRVVADVINSCI